MCSEFLMHCCHLTINTPLSINYQQCLLDILLERCVALMCSVFVWLCVCAYVCYGVHVQ